ncbi:hypothetical protein SIID45300_02247 [Candidatus Magnetaquicoccaceae bacterium FCR-1]|uniref:DUF2442 domain-containing protein n=1 Tax=Candidatus Magnetaquiglobus chichijimensis TaxID=3141448 RepID=A0ABQ0CAK6_9PROT
MSMPRIRAAIPLEGMRLHLSLTDGREIERLIAPWLTGPLFEPIRQDPSLFAQVHVEGGGVAWPNGADLCPDLLIWGGLPPAEDAEPRSDPL